MSKIYPILSTMRYSSNNGLFHDSRADVKSLVRYVNTLQEKINELVISNNFSNSKLADLESKIDQLHRSVHGGSKKMLINGELKCNE
jgi:peptidoglycan hydrolase CwlO-like protein